MENTFLVWDKLLSFHLVVSFADCDIFENAGYNWVLEIGLQDKLTKLWTTIINKNPRVDLLTEQHLLQQNW